MGGVQYFADAPIEPLHHAVGLRVARRRQPVLDTVLGAKLIEGMVPRGFAFLLGEAVGEGLVIVREQFGDDERGLLPEVVEKAQGGLLRLVLVPLQVDPAASPVDGHEQVGAAVLVGHRRQVLDVDMHVARLIILERLLRLVLLALGPWYQRLELRDTMTHQKPLQSRAPHIRLDKLTHDNQQVVRGEKQRLAQRDN